MLEHNAAIRRRTGCVGRNVGRRNKRTDAAQSYRNGHVSDVNQGLVGLVPLYAVRRCGLAKRN